jgi:endonuclease/exonuclease/phosphatase (EEP) superfamily protein YafD
MAAGAVASVATVLGFLGRAAWFLDLFSHFRVQYLIVLAALGFTLLLAKRRRMAALFLLLACANLLVVAPLYFGGQEKPPPGADRLRAMLINVHTKLGDPQRVSQVVRDEDPDILVLEEVSSRWMTELAWLNDHYAHRVTWPREDNFGIALFSKHPLLSSDVIFLGSGEVPTIVATVDTGQGHLHVVATHPLPPAGASYSRARNEQFELLAKQLDASRPTILLGDLNVTPWNTHFHRLLEQSGLHDSTRGYGVQPSWPSHSVLLRIPIDHCLHSPHIRIANRRIGPNVASDHYPLIVDFAIVE